MCAICRQIPCNPRCPNAPEPVPVVYCRMYGNGIMEGSRGLEMPNGVICEDCLDNMDTSDWLELFDERLTVIKEDQKWEI